MGKLQTLGVLMVTGGMAELWKMTVDAVVAAEAVYPQEGKGREKMQMVSSQVQAYAPLVGLGAELIDRLSPLIVAFVTAVVARFNKTGFPAPVPPPEPVDPVEQPISVDATGTK